MKKKTEKTNLHLQKEIEELRGQLAEARETLRAIHEGEVDAVIVSGARGEQVFSLVGAESIYRLIVETMKEAAFTVSFDGTILYSNVRFGEFVGQPSELILGHPLTEFISPDHRADAQRLLEQGQKQAVKQRLVFLGRDGKTLPAHVSSNVLNQPDNLSICVVATDLSDLENSTELIRQLRSQAEAVREGEERYRMLFNSLAEGFCIIEVIFDPDGKPVDFRFLETNPAFETHTGFGNVQGRRVLELAPDLEKHWIEIFGRVVLTGKPTRFVNEALARWYEVGAYRIDGSESRKVAILFNDITDRRKAEEDLRLASEDLSRSNKDLEQFAFVASHDLQEPLRTIGSYVRLLQRKYKGKLDSEADEFINFAVNGTKRMQNLINDLLAYSRIRQSRRKFEQTSFEEILKQVEDDLELVVQASGGTITHAPLPTIKADPAQIAQVFQNLIGNALKFRGDRSPKIHIEAKKEKTEWVFSVRDNGIGFEPQYSERIFVIFQRLQKDEKYPGTGIGLAICKKILERHGGRIWAESTPGEGSVFHFTIPEIKGGHK